MRASIRHALIGVFGLVLTAGLAQAQESKSAAAAAQLVEALENMSLEGVAARMPSENRFVAVRYFQGGPLLVVAADYSAPTLLEPMLAEKNFQDVYVELQSASVPESKIFVTDLGTRGLKARPAEGEPFDTYANGTERISFDGNWRGQNLSEDEYMKRFGEADERYSEMLAQLLQQVKGS